jgi:hypothetical protein
MWRFVRPQIRRKVDAAPGAIFRRRVARLCSSNACSDRVGLNRCLIENLMGYKMVFVSLKSVDKQTRYGIYCKSPFRESPVSLRSGRTWRPNACSGGVGPKRFSIAEFKGYVTVFVSLKSVNKQVRYLISRKSSWMSGVDPIHGICKFTAESLPWSNRVQKTFDRAFYPLSNSRSSSEIRW